MTVLKEDPTLAINVTESDRRVLSRLYEAAREIQSHTTLRMSLVLPLHIAPTVRAFRGMVVEHSAGARTSHVAVLPR